MWDLPGPGVKPVSPALAGRLLTTALPGEHIYNIILYFIFGNLSSKEQKIKFNKMFLQSGNTDGSSQCIRLLGGEWP